MINITVIVQARMGSSRLYGKVLKLLNGIEVLSYDIERCKRIKGIREVVVATTLLEQDDQIVNWCEINKIPYFRGDENDVLSRYVQCADMYKPDYVMRVTSDCPFVDYEMASEIVELMQQERRDIVILNGELARGLAVELISYEALLKINELGKEPRHREHVTYYAYEFKEQFEAVMYNVPTNRQAPQFRITLDTEEDYAMLTEIAKHFNNPLVSSVDVIEFLKATPEVANINAHIEQKPVV